MAMATSISLSAARADCFYSRIKLSSKSLMQPKIYDVVVIGSGAGGGTLSARLANLGADVLVLEGGPQVNTRTDFNTHALPFEFPSRHIPTMRPGKPGFDAERSRGL